MAHTELGLRERRAIEDMLHAKVPVNEIAAAIGRHRSTIRPASARNSSVRFSPIVRLLCCNKCYQKSGIKPRHVQ
nr:helix-turn-helix domain-containing protein [Rhodophyticola sp. CCM32]